MDSPRRGSPAVHGGEDVTRLAAIVDATTPPGEYIVQRTGPHSFDLVLPSAAPVEIHELLAHRLETGRDILTVSLNRDGVIAVRDDRFDTRHREEDASTAETEPVADGEVAVGRSSGGRQPSPRIQLATVD
ncbi:hypothetical protein [Natrinema gelatinilyticum]|uniref:hypothetical protein n=1 Tax=Natrinema gelatinilyticum TaxID=2961571 RepID=UPI0020C4EBA4|nr:hypothetical protein [Natrinema gelatinilyticum]